MLALFLATPLYPHFHYHYQQALISTISVAHTYRCSPAQLRFLYGTGVAQTTFHCIESFGQISIDQKTPKTAL